jgi:uncharacterized membrane protein
VLNEPASAPVAGVFIVANTENCASVNATLENNLQFVISANLIEIDQKKAISKK